MNLYSFWIEEVCLDEVGRPKRLPMSHFNLIYESILDGYDPQIPLPEQLVATPNYKWARPAPQQFLNISKSC